MAKTPDLKPGDKVLYRGAWGSGARPKAGKIVGGSYDHDRNAYLYDVELDSGEGYWGYRDQFTKI